jgi:hypothetical protein
VTRTARTALAALLAAAALAAALAGCGQAAAPPASKPVGEPIACPSDAPPGKTLDARTLVGVSERRAAATADRHGCTMVAVARDGERFSITANVDPRRVQVEVDGGVVTRIVKVG